MTYYILITPNHLNASISPKNYHYAPRDNPREVAHARANIKVHFCFISPRATSIWSALQTEVTTALSVNTLIH